MAIAISNSHMSFPLLECAPLVLAILVGLATDRQRRLWQIVFAENCRCERVSAERVDTSPEVAGPSSPPVHGR
jgi:hypothetical protein